MSQEHLLDKNHENDDAINSSIDGFVDFGQQMQGRESQRRTAVYTSPKEGDNEKGQGATDKNGQDAQLPEVIVGELEPNIKRVQTVPFQAAQDGTDAAENKPKKTLADIFFSPVGLSNFFDEDNLNCLTYDGKSYSLDYLHKAGNTKILMQKLRTDSEKGIQPRPRPKNEDESLEIKEEQKSVDKDGKPVEEPENLEMWEEVQARMEEYGKNDPMPSNLSSWGTLVASFFEDFTTRLLMLVCIISIILQFQLSQEDNQQMYIEGGAVFGTLIVISIIQAWVTRGQERRIQDIKLASSTTRVSVIREGKRQNIESSELVVGDIIKLGKGQQVPADCILIEPKEGGIKVTDGYNVEKEVVPYEKNVNEDPFVTGKYFIVEGQCKAIVCAVGTRAQFGMIKESISTASYKESHFQKKLEHISDTIAKTAYAAGFIVFLAACVWTTLQIVNSDDYFETGMTTAFYTQKYVQVFMLSVTLVMLIVPEGLPLIVTLSLAYSLQRLQANNNIVQSLESPEVMAIVDNIVTESSGILTDNDMKVKACYFVKDKILDQNQYESIKNGQNNLRLMIAEAILYCSSCYEEEVEIPNQLAFEAQSEEIIRKKIMETKLRGKQTEIGLVKFIQDSKIRNKQEIQQILHSNERMEMESNSKIVFSSQKKFSGQKLKRQQEKESEAYYDKLPSLFKTYKEESEKEGDICIWVFKGSKDVLLDNCSQYIDEKGNMQFLQEDHKALIRAKAEEIETDRMRSLILSFKILKEDDPDSSFLDHDEADQGEHKEKVPTQMVLISLIGLRDELRKDLPDAIEQCRDAIKVRMLTGDSKQVAWKLAKQANIIKEDSQLIESKSMHSRSGTQIDMEKNSEISTCMEGKDLQRVAQKYIKEDWLDKTRLTKLKIEYDTYDQNNRAALVKYINKQVWQDTKYNQFDIGQYFQKEFLESVYKNVYVLANAEPKDSRFFIALLQTQNKVAATGFDNKDFQILQSSDIGYSMGKNGSDIANYGADVIILDDNFKSMLTTVNFGRNIFRVVQEFIQFQISSNIIIVIPIFFSLCVYSESCLNSVQLLWINFIMDCFAALVLGNQPPIDDTLKGNKPDLESIIAPTMWRNIIGQAFYMILFTLVVLFAGASIFSLPPISAKTPLYYSQAYLNQTIEADPTYISTYNQPGYYDIEVNKPTSKLIVYSLVFNLIVCMMISHLFIRRFGPVNMNKRKNNADSKGSIKFFILACLTLLVSQFLVMIFASPIIGTTKLSINQYLFCMFIAFFQVVWTLLINVTIPDDVFERTDDDEDDNFQKAQASDKGSMSQVEGQQSEVQDQFKDAQ